MNNIGIGDQAIEAMRLGGIGWIFAFFVVGATILAGRWMLSWQMRRIDRIMARKAEDGDKPGAGMSAGDAGETPRDLAAPPHAPKAKPLGPERIGFEVQGD